MFGAAAVRNKKLKAERERNAAELPRGPVIKPFGPRFDPNELPYFKYKKALQEAKELQQNISRAKKVKVQQLKSAAVAGAEHASNTEANGGGKNSCGVAAGSCDKADAKDALQGRMKVVHILSNANGTS